jgi:hypothetical protein
MQSFTHKFILSIFHNKVRRRERQSGSKVRIEKKGERHSGQEQRKVSERKLIVIKSI